MDRRKPTDTKDPPGAEDLNDVGATTEPVSGPASHPENSEEEEVCLEWCFLPWVPLLSSCLRGWGSGNLPSWFLPLLGGGGVVMGSLALPVSLCCLRES